MDRNPLISIVLPTYNRAAMLKTAIQSVLAQGYENWELIVIDNYSIDGTEYVISEFKDARIKCLKIKNNGSIGKSRNLGIKQALGEWIAFIDSDDWWAPGKLEACSLHFKKDVDLIYHDLFLSLDGSVKKWKKIKSRKLKRPVLHDLLVRGNPIANSSVILRAALLKKIGYLDESMGINPCVDYHTWLKVAKISNGFKYIDRALGCYAVHSGGVSQCDMSMPEKLAVEEFQYLINDQEKIKIEIRFTYIAGRFNYLVCNYEKSLKFLLIVIRSGCSNFYVKSILMILLIVWRKRIVSKWV